MPALMHPPSSISNRNAMPLDIALAAAGGYADAASYLLAGSFTGHLTGNTVLSAIALGGEDPHKLVLPVLAVVLFLCGTATGLSIGRLESRGLKPLMVALPLEMILVGWAAMSQMLSPGHAKLIIVACLCIALGIQNGVFRKTDGVSVHATYVTGDVTSLVASILRTSPEAHSQDSIEKKRQERGTALKVLSTTWLSFSGGALVSVLMVHRFGIPALWLLELPLILAASAAWLFPAGGRSSA